MNEDPGDLSGVVVRRIGERGGIGEEVDQGLKGLQDLLGGQGQVRPDEGEEHAELIEGCQPRDPADRTRRVCTHFILCDGSGLLLVLV